MWSYIHITCDGTNTLSINVGVFLSIKQCRKIDVGYLTMWARCIPVKFSSSFIADSLQEFPLSKISIWNYFNCSICHSLIVQLPVLQRSTLYECQTPEYMMTDIHLMQYVAVQIATFTNKYQELHHKILTQLKSSQSNRLLNQTWKPREAISLVSQILKYF